MTTITSHPQNYAMVQITIVAYSHVDRVGSKTVEAASEEQREEWIRVDKSLDNEDHDPDYIVGKVKSGYYRETTETKTVFVQDGGNYLMATWVHWLKAERMELSFLELFDNNLVIGPDAAKKYAFEMTRYIPRLAKKYKISSVPDFSSPDWADKCQDTMEEPAYFFYALFHALEVAAEGGFLMSRM